MGPNQVGKNSIAKKFYELAACEKKRETQASPYIFYELTSFDDGRESSIKPDITIMTLKGLYYHVRYIFFTLEHPVPEFFLKKMAIWDFFTNL